ncbi:MAG: Gfo/Idh/MocA family oxidoreductase [Spirochaetaceae bacterium]|nr:Gfo/Idh/MocA family oxidoreductase [Spirochaetaceae bacterium]
MLDVKTGGCGGEKLNAAIIGLGRVASLLEDDSLREKPCTHAGAITANSDCVLAGGMDIDSQKRRLFSERWGVPVFEQAEEMIHKVKPSILCVSTHPDSHAYYCALAASCGVPLVVCEKPLSHTLIGARKIRAIHDGGITKVLVNHERRYSENYIKIKQFLEENRAGKILSVSAKLYMGKSQRLVDVFWHDGTHLVDAIMFLTGGTLIHKKTFPQSISRQKGTCFLFGTIKENGVPVVIEIGAGRDHLLFEIEISCEKGMVRIGNDIFEIFASAVSQYASGFLSLKKISSCFTDKTHYFSNMMADAVRCVCSSQEPLSNARTGYAVVKYLDAAAGKW